MSLNIAISLNIKMSLNTTISITIKMSLNVTISLNIKMPLNTTILMNKKIRDNPNCALEFLDQFRRNALKNQFKKQKKPSKRGTNSILLKVLENDKRRSHQ